MQKLTPRRTIHYSELQSPPPDAVWYREWHTWRREMPRLLAEGHEGKYFVFFGEEMHGPYDDLGEALTAAYQKYGLQARFMIRQIFENEPLIYSKWLR